MIITTIIIIPLGLPGRNWSGDEGKSKKKEILILDLQLTTYIL